MRRRFAELVLVCLVTLVAQASPGYSQQWKTDIDWTKLNSEVPGLENGAGLAVGMTEAPINGNGDFMPDVNWGQFTGKTITNGSNGNNAPSGHATVMAQTFFGNTVSIAPGVTNITAFEANDWIINRIGFGDVEFGGNIAAKDPEVQAFKVHNNSWIGTGLTNAQVADMSRRIDFTATRDGVTFVGGTNNGSSNPLPQLLAHSYNAIIVGLTNGNHAAGSTSTYGNPRVRPDIVAPIGSTSEATAIVSSAATLLHHKAGNSLAGRIDTMRAVILAGATKEEIPTWDRTTTRPMDDRFGAGELNVYNSYRIIEGGQFAGSTTAPSTAVGELGWDYQTSISSGQPLYYDFEVGAGEIMENLSIALTWNMQITDTNASTSVFAPTELLGDLNLDFFDSSGSFLGSLLDSSLATGGNVEHLYFEALNAGRYTLRVSTNTTRDFALAWRSSLTAIPEPGLVGLCGLIVFAAAASRRRRVA